MKAIIDGKRFDTDTAEKVAGASGGGYSMRDFRYWSEDLYRTPKGAWFIYGEGGALSSYAKPVGNNGYCGGEAIRRLTSEEARAWLEQNRETDAIETYFPDAIEDA